MFPAFSRNQQGAVAIEYGLIVALVVIAAIAGISALGGTSSGSLGATYDKIGAHLSK